MRSPPSILVASADAVNVTQGLDDNALTVDDLNAATVAIHQVDRVEITGTVESGDVYTLAVQNAGRPERGRAECSIAVLAAVAHLLPFTPRPSPSD